MKWKILCKIFGHICGYHEEKGKCYVSIKCIRKDCKHKLNFFKDRVQFLKQ